MGNRPSTTYNSNGPSSPQPQSPSTPTTTSASQPDTSTSSHTANVTASHTRHTVVIPTTTRVTRQSPRTNMTSRGSSSRASLLKGQSVAAKLASQTVIVNSVNNYVIPAAAPREQRSITPCQARSWERLLVCPQYNGRECVVEECRRLHVCYHWATKTCTRNSCKHYHSLESPHNQRLIQACLGKQKVPHVSEVIREDGPLFSQSGPQICLFSVFNKCTKESCPRVHYSKNYLWEVHHGSEWRQLSFSQSDYLEMMYSHPSEDRVDLPPLTTPLPNNKSIRKLASLLSMAASWTVDLEVMLLRGGSLVLDVRRLSTTSDLTSQVPVATRWLWYWQDDDGRWEVYGEGVINDCYHVALSDSLEMLLRVHSAKTVTFSVGHHRYSLNGEEMIQTNLATGKKRSVRRRPASSSVHRNSVKFDDLFLPLPDSKTFLKLPVLPLTSEFVFVENLMRQTLTDVKVASIHRVQNNHLWMAYQTKKRLLTSLYGGEVTATNEQYLFHGTRLDVVDLICDENLDWKLCGTNVGHQYGRGTYFSNLALKAHQYTKHDETGRRVMLVVVVLVGKMTKGHKEMTLPPMNTTSGRTYDTTCDSSSNPTIFVKYNRDEYYPAYVIRYSC